VNASCIASATFTPTRRNLRTSALRITDNAPEQSTERCPVTIRATP
jgi:hypothetical protein